MITFTAPSRSHRVILTRVVWSQIRTHARTAAPSECGGVLLGSITDDGAALISDMVTPTDSRGGRTWFERGTEGLAIALEDAWTRVPRTHYIGEWHSHPGGSGTPSDGDRTQMRLIAGDPLRRCPVPILLICHGSGKVWHPSLWAFPHRSPPISLARDTPT